MKTTLLALLLCLPLLLRAQGENTVWVMGYGDGLDFSSGTPVRIGTASATFEGTAAVSSPSGRLRFYTDGFRAYTRLNKVMPNGDALLSNGSVTQAVAIVPFPGDTDRYHLFVLSDDTSRLPFHYLNLNHSVVDMRLNGGLGAVAEGQKNRCIDTVLSEKMVVARSADCGYWLLVHSMRQSAFHAFRITASGLDPMPVLSATPSVARSFGIGEMKMAPDNRRLALANWVSKGQLGSIELFDFDSTYGRFSDYRLIDSSTQVAAYGLAFSPDGSKLYAAYGEDEPRMAYPLVQYDLNLLDDVPRMRAEKTVLATVHPGVSWAGMRTYRAKVYVISGAKVHVINRPDEPGTACAFQKDLFSFERPFCSLGNEVPESEISRFTRSDTVSCVPVRITGPAGRRSYLWQDGDTARSRVLQPGATAWLRSDAGSCAVRVDTFYVRDNGFALQLDKTQYVCEGSSATLAAGVSGGRLLWNNGSGSASITVTTPGTYWVQVTKDGCTLSDTTELRSCNRCVGLPNAFSPNDDGINDGFRPLLSCPVQRYELKIFNRYGQLVFGSDDPLLSWDGRYRGQPLDLGTYFYLLRLRPDRPGAAEELYKGDLQLLR